MAISIRFLHPDISISYFRDGIVYSSIDKFKYDFKRLITTEYHLYKKGEGYLLRVLDNNGYYHYDLKVYLIGDDIEKEECIKFIQDRAILQKIFEGV